MDTKTPLQRLLEHLEALRDVAKYPLMTSSDRDERLSRIGALATIDHLRDWITANLSDGWLDIQSAPRDGSWFLSWSQLDGVNMTMGSEDGFWEKYRDRIEPTKWQPFPGPPAGKEEA